MKKEKESQMKEVCTFIPKTSRCLSKSKSRPTINRSRLESCDLTPTKINYRAIDKFVNRQQLARCLKKEKEIYQEKLEAGSMINHK
mmetsp:Transcript_25381/g.22521  ORF Transcript_25381/g.22521 Transcript_25381/m.22521 type:complete len:86 (+) Transcript_25381:32-289(+)